MVSIWAGTTGQLDELEISDVRPFEAALHEYIAHNKPQIYDAIATGAKLDDDTVAALEAAVTEAKEQFMAERDAARAEASDK